jgi:hypothetical protein
MSKARELANLGNAYSDGALSNRNLLINSAMQVAQRGTSATVSNGNAGYKTVDRWKFNESGADTYVMTMSQDSDAPEGFGFSCKYLVTTADTSLDAACFLRHTTNLEGQNLQQVKKGTASAEKLTVSFWVKSNVTGLYVFEIRDVDNNRTVNKTYTINSADTWEYKTVSIPADTTGLLDNDNNLSFECSFVLAAGSNFTSGTLQTSWGPNTLANRGVGQTNLVNAVNNYWQITGVQLEVGDTATPFEHRSYGDELARCQRYYYREESASGLMFGSVGFADSSTNAYLQHPHPVRMRASPTLSTTGVASDYALRRGGNTLQCNNVPTLSSTTPSVAHVLWRTSSGLTSGQAVVGKHTGANDFLGWDAEL